MTKHHDGRRFSAGPSASSFQAEVEVTHDIGLHARPSVVFTRLAKSFPCVIELEVNGKVMGARHRKGFLLAIRAEGVGAEEAIRALRGLVERNFDEEGSHARSA